jgi:AcrR family transcriptional regulator
MARKAAPKPTDRRETYHHGDLRRALLDAARQEIAAHGAERLSLASLARRAGVAQSAPYRHFADRDQLLAAVATDGFEAFTRALLEAAAGDDAGAIARMSAAYLRFGEENVELYRLMFASRLVPAAAEGSPLQTAAAASFQPLLDRVAAAHPRRSQTFARARWAQLHGLVMLKADGFIDEPADALLAAVSM